jgi:formyl-CoA transferase
VIKDPQLRYGIVVPPDGAGGKLTSTISRPRQVHDVAKLPAKRAPELGEHNEVILRELGFDPQTISRFRAGGAIATAGPHGGKT